MSIGQLLFSFNGRIPRSTYWLASIAISVIGMGGVLTASYYMTGEVFSRIVFLQARDKVDVWLPIWGGYMLLMLWPGLAIVLKRWHDRNRPTWVYLLILPLFVIPMGLRIAGYGPLAADLETPDWVRNPDANGPANQIVTLLFMPLSFYLLIELGFLRGTRGPNRYGEDPLPPEPETNEVKPGFVNWMFGLKGRINRSQWWLGVAIVLGTLAGILTIEGTLANYMVPFNDPSTARKMADPHWIKSPAGTMLMVKMVAFSVLATLSLLLPFWNLTAISVKRLHDQSTSGWWVLAVIGPLFLALMMPGLVASMPHPKQTGLIAGAWLIYGVAALWCLVQFGMIAGKEGPNEYGPPPARQVA